MANELTITVELKLVNGTKIITFGKSGIQTNMSGNDYIRATQTVTTSEAALGKGSITTPGLCVIFNRDATNFVKVRGASGAVDCVKIKPGEPALFRHAGSAPYVIADTASCEIEYLLIED